MWLILSLWTLCICLFQYIDAIEPKLISAEFHQTFSSCQVYVTLGDYVKQIKLQIDMTSQYNWVSFNNNTPYPLSPTSRIIRREMDVLHDYTVIHGVEIEEGFYYDKDKENRDMPISVSRFYILGSEMAKRTGHEGVLSLPFIFKDLNHSIIHYYYNQGYINQLSFSIVNKGFKRYISFGGIPQDDIQNKTISHCDILNVTSNWDCSMDKVIFKNGNDMIEFDNKDFSNKATFNPVDDFIYAPKEFIDLLYDYYRSPQFELYCSTDKEFNRRQLYCSNSIKLATGTLTFLIGDYQYEFDIYNFWMCFDELCYLRITQDVSYNRWVIGAGFFKTYDILFDYTDKRITIYSDKGVSYIKDKRETYRGFEVIVYITICLILLGGIGLIVILRKIKV